MYLVSKEYTHLCKTANVYISRPVSKLAPPPARMCRSPENWELVLICLLLYCLFNFDLFKTVNLLGKKY